MNKMVDEQAADVAPNPSVDRQLNLYPLPMVHHASASGYDRVADHLGGVIVPPTEKSTLGHRVLGRLAKELCQRSGSRWYSRDSFLRELSAAREWYSHRGRVFHFLYGENSFRYLGQLKKFQPSRNALVATYHTPPQRFNEVVENQAHVGSLDAVILMSNSQRATFEQLIDPERIHFVPHGIDTAHFTPGNQAESRFERLRQDSTAKFNCLAVGRMLRDYDTLAAAARTLEQSHPNIHFQIVASAEVQPPFDGLGNVTFFSQIDDQQLLDLYREAAVLTLPMHDCTANNVLLEGMACGLPVVATDLQGVRDYTNAECVSLVPAADGIAFGRELVRLSENIDLVQARAKASRAQAESLAWPKIGNRLRQVYETLL